MRVRFLAICATAALVVPAAAQTAPARPNRYQVVTTVAPGGHTALTIGKVPKGEFAFALRASSDGEKAFTLTQQRAGGTRFTVLAAPGPIATDACEGAAGSLFCNGITTPATPGRRRWTFDFTNTSNRPQSITLTITWRAVASAG